MPRTAATIAAAIAGAAPALPAERPELMAIGDSLFNGTRSLVTGGSDLAEKSVPVRVAKWLGLWPARFVAPDYPRKVVIDLEEIVRKYTPLDFADSDAKTFIRTSALENASAWMGSARQWSAHATFDNLAIAGATTDELLNTTAKGAWAAAQKAFRQMEQTDIPIGSFIAAAATFYFNINAAFLLNPTGRPELDDLSQMDFAVARKPRRLLISIGHNDGVFLRILLGQSHSAGCQEQLAALPGQAKRIAARLKDLPADTHIYFNSMLKPSTVANLGPQQDALMNPRLHKKPGAGKYFAPGYHSKLLGQVSFTRKTMEDFDNTIRDVNVAVKRALEKELGATAGRLHFLNFWDFSEGLNSKHRDIEWPVKITQTNGREVELRNIPAGWTGTTLVGGLFGLDNMHPSGVGYQLIANHILRAIATTDGTAPPEHYHDIQKAYEADTLLTDFPRNWSKSFTGYKDAFSIAGALGLFKSVMGKFGT